MLRVFIALGLFSLYTLYACEGGFSSCIQKVKNSHSLDNNTLSLPISKTKRLLFSINKPKGKILKQDPFLGLYIMQGKEGFRYPFKINMRAPSGLAAITKTASVEGRIFKRQIGLNNLAQFKYALKPPAILTSSCCSLEGILTSRGVIEKVYINRFIHAKDTRYGDIGIRVEDAKKSLKGVYVSSYDPFMKNNPFKIGDRILSMDGKKIYNAAQLMRKILFASIGSSHKLKVKRKGKIHTLKVQTQVRLSGGYKVETYLEKYGWTFDKDLYLIKVDASKNIYKLKVGDQLLKVNSYTVKNQKDVMQHISQFKRYPNLLFERNKNFQFFVQIR